MARIPSPAAARLGATITSLRKSRGLTIDDLASKTRIDSANIRSDEAGRALVGLHSLVKIATALDVESGLLLEGVELSMFESAGTRRGRAANESTARA